jgi:hypothetical protein
MTGSRQLNPTALSGRSGPGVAESVGDREGAELGEDDAETLELNGPPGAGVRATEALLVDAQPAASNASAANAAILMVLSTGPSFDGYERRGTWLPSS